MKFLQAEEDDKDDADDYKKNVDAAVITIPRCFFLRKSDNIKMFNNQIICDVKLNNIHVTVVY